MMNCELGGYSFSREIETVFRDTFGMKTIIEPKNRELTL